MSSLNFEASSLPGAGRGRTLGTPTLNLRPEHLPPELQDGVYACRVALPGKTGSYFAVMHKGARPTFGDTPTCEVHLLDHILPAPPERITVTVVERMREVRTFPSVQELREQIARDIAQARGILSAA